MLDIDLDLDRSRTLTRTLESNTEMHPVPSLPLITVFVKKAASVQWIKITYTDDTVDNIAICYTVTTRLSSGLLTDSLAEYIPGCQKNIESFF